MLRRFVILRAMLLMAWLVQSAWGQSQPPAITGIAGKTTISDADRSSIEQYVRHWANALNQAGDPAAIVEAKDQLLAPLKGRPSLVFRDAYGRVIVPALESNLNDRPPFAASSAVIVIARTGTQQALDRLIPLIEPRSPLHVRITAARGVREILQGGTLTAVNPNAISGIARRLRDATTSEKNWLVLGHLLQGILAADRMTLTPPTHRQVEESLMAAIRGIADRAINTKDLQEAVDYSNALMLVLDDLRDHLFQISSGGPRQESLARLIGPALVNALQIPSAHWEAGHQDERISQDLERLINSTEVFLRLSHPVAAGGDRAPNATLQQAWAAQNANDFASGLSTWQQVVSRPPYDAR